MNERDFPGRPKVTFGIRVPNSGPLASPESIVQVAREAESLVTIPFGFTTTSRGRKRFTALTSLQDPKIRIPTTVRTFTKR